MARTDDLDQTSLALAALAAAFAHTLAESDKSFPSRLSANIQKVHQVLRDGPYDADGASQTLKWTGELLKELER